MGNSPAPVNSPHKGQWRGALMFSLICVWINGWVNNREAGDLRRHLGHNDVIVMEPSNSNWAFISYDRYVNSLQSIIICIYGQNLEHNVNMSSGRRCTFVGNVTHMLTQIDSCGFQGTWVKYYFPQTWGRLSDFFLKSSKPCPEKFGTVEV